MAESIQQHVKNLYSKDKNQQGVSYKQLMELTEQPVDWAYEIWDDLLDLLENGDNRTRSIAGQILSNLAKSDPDGRMKQDFTLLLAGTRDERFVTARHILQSLWKVGIVNIELQDITVSGLSRRYEDCADEKNCTLIRYDICRELRKIYDHTEDEQIFEKTMSLIEDEPDQKYRKKYLKEWRDVVKDNQ